jgi:CheY-like chemotaxis protein
MAVESIQLLLVDPDIFLQEMIESGFRLFNPKYQVVKAQNPESALLLLQRHEIEAIITELDFPGARKAGSEFLEDLGDYSPDLPIILLSERVPETLPTGRVPRAFVPKPPDMDYLLKKVHQVVQQNRASILRGISLESFLQVLEVEQKTCTLVVRSDDGRTGRLYISQGKLIHATTDESHAKAAAFAMLGWSDPEIKILEKCDAEPTITDRLNAILLEYCVQKDHGLVQ